jgi:mono/diheme cytochrome c family protein
VSRFRISSALLCALAVALTTGCEKRVELDYDGKPVLGEDGKPVEYWTFTGQPDPAKKWKAPQDVTDFNKLYTKYCLACHSISSETVSPVVAMGNPTYLSIVPEDVLRSAIVNGVPGSLMPPFAKKNGGEMTDDQVEIVVKGILAKKPATIDPAIPAYSAPLGNPEAGKALYEQSVFAHAKDVEHSILNPAFLGTITDQYLRTLLIAGLPQLTPSAEEGEHELPPSTDRHEPIYPDYRGIVPGRALTSQDVSDLAAWILSHRENEYGQRVPASATPTPGPVNVPTSTPGQPAVSPERDSAEAQQLP